MTVRVAKRGLRIDRLGPGVDQTGADLRIASPGRNQSPAVGSQFAMAAGPCPTQGEFLGGRAVPTALELSCGWTGIQLVQVVQIIIVKVLSESSAHPCTGSLLDEPGSMLSDERSKLSATPFSALACQVGKRVHWSDSRKWPWLPRVGVKATGGHSRARDSRNSNGPIAVSQPFGSEQGKLPPGVLLLDKRLDSLRLETLPPPVESDNVLNISAYECDGAEAGGLFLPLGSCDGQPPRQMFRLNYIGAFEARDDRLPARVNGFTRRNVRLVAGMPCRAAGAKSR